MFTLIGKANSATLFDVFVVNSLFVSRNKEREHLCERNNRKTGRERTSEANFFYYREKQNTHARILLMREIKNHN